MQDNFILSPIKIEDLKLLIRQAVLDVINDNTGENNSLLSSEQVKDLLKISHTTLQKWRDERKIPFVKIGNKIFYNKADVLGMFRERSNP